MDPKKPDPELLEELELLLNWEEISEESEWETILNLEEVEDEPS
jgi:hypothetical protein